MKTSRQIPRAETVRDLPATVPAIVAGRYFGIGKEGTYRLIQANDFPVPVLRIGARYVVTQAALADALGVSLDVEGSMKGAKEAGPGEPRASRSSAHPSQAPTDSSEAL
ncbi:hypothetical protein [Isoptericola sediminis]|uniref:Uncharacterized protein n=1 Tax=Isoptericola sediminis TaxID=2733572 RepID=A0A849JYV5_9MICO|nr:hypothetical protein [Isoptericola sediminis]NNU28462.1 hypothetical protein [Isoptericola sediminis]